MRIRDWSSDVCSSDLITFECMWKGIQQVRNGATLGDVGNAIQKHAESSGYSVVREFCGHGIGQRFHEDPQVLHYGKPGSGMRLTTGLIFTIEPMINAGRREIRQLADGWTVVTRDHSLSAQWEHPVCVADTAPKSVGKGKRGSVRVDSGGGQTI